MLSKCEQPAAAVNSGGSKKAAAPYSTGANVLQPVWENKLLTLADG